MDSESQFDEINNKQMIFLNDDVQRLSPKSDLEHKEFINKFFIDLQKLSSDVDIMNDET